MGSFGGGAVEDADGGADVHQQGGAGHQLVAVTVPTCGAEQRLTYDDLLRLAELILQNDEVANLYRCLFGCVLVDEFQDLTLQQLRVINQIGRPVADDDRCRAAVGHRQPGGIGLDAAQPDAA